MASCRDCIHYDVCATKDEKISLATRVKELVADNFTCFKNKADFVEVIHCRDCDVPHNKFTGCPKLNGLIPPPNYYCAGGERKADANDGS